MPLRSLTLLLRQHLRSGGPLRPPGLLAALVRGREGDGLQRRVQGSGLNESCGDFVFFEGRSPQAHPGWMGFPLGGVSALPQMQLTIFQLALHRMHTKEDEPHPVSLCFVF